MVTFVCLLWDWGDPDGIDAQSLKIVQLPPNPLESPSTIVAEVTTGRIALSLLSEPISKELEERQTDGRCLLYTWLSPTNFVVKFS